MTGSLRLSDPLLPPAPGGMGRGAVFALLAHAALLVALTLGVQWRASPPEVFSAELWAALPQQAAPMAEPAPPAPPAAPTPLPARPAAPPEADAQIAIERARIEKERERARLREAERARQAQLEREQREAREKREREQRERELREKKAAEARLAQEIERRREENLRRMLSQAGSGPAGATGSAAADAAPSRSYAGLVVARIKPNIVFTGNLPGPLVTEVEVRATVTGTIYSREILKKSGNDDWDQAVLRAIDRTGSLPRDVDGRVPPRLVIAFRPQELR